MLHRAAGSALPTFVVPFRRIVLTYFEVYTYAIDAFLAVLLSTLAAVFKGLVTCTND